MHAEICVMIYLRSIWNVDCRRICRFDGDDQWTVL